MEKLNFTFFSFRNRYLPALFILALFALLSFLNLKEVTNSITNEGKIINLSGKQRMLSQKLILLGEKYLQNKTKQNRSFLIDHIKQMETSHNYLVNNTSETILAQCYFDNKLDFELKQYLLSFKEFSQNPKQLTLDNLKTKSQALLVKLDNTVKLYESNYEKKINRLKKEGSFIFYGILLILFFEAIFVFRPASKQIKRNSELQQKVIQEKTKQLEKSFDMISENVIYSRTDKKGFITYASKAFCKISGYKKDELIGQPHNIIRHPDMSKEAFREMWSTIQNGKTWTGEVKNLKKDGGFYWVNATISPEYDLQNNLIGYAAVRHNITLKKELETLNTNLESKIQFEVENNRKKDQQLFEQAKSLQLNEMISNIAHHWRQPLSLILTSASAIKMLKDMRILQDEELEKYIDNISLTTQELSNTIEKFSNFLNIKNDPIFFKVEKLVDNTLDIVEPSLKNIKIDIIKDYQQQTIQINSIPQYLSQVILNIIYNARDAFERNNQESNIITLSVLKKEDDSVIITIENNGGNIAENILPKIFDPYFTTKHKSQGTGLGLYLSYKMVVEDLKGKLYVKNTLNGVKFFIELPLSS